MFRIGFAAIGLLFALSAASAGAEGGIGDRCGGSTGTACAAGLWCEPPAGMCDGANLIGTCVDGHRRCHHNYHPVCGCDGITYGNDCARQHESVPANHTGKC